MRRVWSDIRIGVRIARAELHDLIRRNASTRREKALIVLVALFFLPMLVSVVQGGYNLGVATRDGVDAPVVAAMRNLLIPGLLVFAVLGGLGAAQSIARDSVRPLLLTSAPTRAIVLGKVLYLLVTWLVMPTFLLLGAISYAAGARTPLFVGALVGAMLPVLLLMMLCGLSLAYLLWIGIERLGLPDYARRLVTAGISIVVFVVALAIGFFAGQFSAESPTDALPTGDPLTPLGYYADLFFLGSPAAEPLTWQTLFAAGVVLTAIPLSFRLLVRLAPRYWYAVPTVDADETEHHSDSTQPVTFDRTPSETIGRTPTGDVLASAVARVRTLRTTLLQLRNGYRRPDQFVYLFYYLFPVAVGLLPIIAETPGNAPGAVGGAFLLLGVWFAGGVFCLNPLGVEGSMLSQLVLAETPATTFVHGRLLAGLVVGLPFALLGAALLVVQVTVGPATVALGFVLAGTVVLVSAALALGIGSVLPKFETVEVFDSVETLAPSIIAAIIHGVVTLVLTAGAVVLTLLVTLPESDLSVTQRLLALAGFGLFAVVVGDGSRRYAIARFSDYGRTRAQTDIPFRVYFAFGLAVLALVLGQFVAVAVVLVFGIDVTNSLTLPVLFVVEYLAYALVALGFVYVTHRGWSYLDIDRPTLQDLAFVGGGVVASLALYGVVLTAVSGLGLPAADHSLFDAGEIQPELLLVLAALMVTVNGPVEELLFRNGIQKYLDERLPTAAAIVTASAIFAVVHLPVYLTAGVGAAVVTLSVIFCISLVWGWIYARTERLLVVGAIHGIYNAVLVLGLYVSVT
ncbi:CPBP family glutamic-type intramembrane protease [Halovenus marina]|uniref:CPBP family glutamic-type intramembrane protease n=1 Tax=Halovenus marina TaxID=3396621 RepID=UPI003F5440B1